MNQTPQEDCPRSVILAERLLWLSAAIAVFFTLAGYVGFLQITTPGKTVISNFITVAFLVLCANKIGAGRNWARWLVLVVFALGSLTLPLVLIFAPQILRSMPVLLVVVGLLQFAIQLTALVLAFIPSSKSWFRRPAQIAQ